jgi:hypothetical protein
VNRIDIGAALVYDFIALPGGSLNGPPGIWYHDASDVTSSAVRTYVVLAEVREMAGKVVGIFRPLLPPVIRKSGG